MNKSDIDKNLESPPVFDAMCEHHFTTFSAHLEFDAMMGAWLEIALSEAKRKTTSIKKIGQNIHAIDNALVDRLMDAYMRTEYYLYAKSRFGFEYAIKVKGEFRYNIQPYLRCTPAIQLLLPFMFFSYIIRTESNLETVRKRVIPANIEDNFKGKHSDFLTIPPVKKRAFTKRLPDRERTFEKLSEIISDQKKISKNSTRSKNSVCPTMIEYTIIDEGADYYRWIIQNAAPLYRNHETAKRAAFLRELLNAVEEPLLKAFLLYAVAQKTDLIADLHFMLHGDADVLGTLLQQFEELPSDLAPLQTYAPETTYSRLIKAGCLSIAQAIYCSKTYAPSSEEIDSIISAKYDLQKKHTQEIGDMALALSSKSSKSKRQAKEKSTPSDDSTLKFDLMHQLVYDWFNRNKNALVSAAETNRVFEMIEFFVNGFHLNRMINSMHNLEHFAEKVDNLLSSLQVYAQALEDIKSLRSLTLTETNCR